MTKAAKATATILWCPQCGTGPKCDEDGCCLECGALCGIIIPYKEPKDGVCGRATDADVRVCCCEGCKDEDVHYSEHPCNECYILRPTCYVSREE